MSTEIQKTGEGVKGFLAKPQVTEAFKKILGDRSSAFLTTVTQIAMSNRMLADADPLTIYGAAMTAATLDLPVNPNLGFAYIIPYVNKGKKEAQFQIGYKGLVQLAQRSGQIRTLSVTEVREGQIVSEDPLKGFEFDWTKKGGKVCGYAAHMALTNGFEKTLYASREDIEAHARRFSKTFSSGPWQTDFDAMARKTILKRLISTFAPLSVEMQDAIIRDTAVVREGTEGFEVKYVDRQESAVGGDVVEDTLAKIHACTTTAELVALHASLPPAIHAEQWYQEASDTKEFNLKEAGK